MKKNMVIHPFLFAIFPILALYVHNISEVKFSDTIVPIAIIEGLALLLLLSSWMILKDIKKSGIMVSIFFVLFFSYGYAFKLIEHWQIGIISFWFAWKYLFLLIAWCIIFAYSAYIVVRTRTNLHNLTNIFNIMAASLIIISSINYGLHMLKQPNNNLQYTTDIEEIAVSSRQSDTLPDIYYIILDRYASDSTLKEFYNFDNCDFTNYLVNKGFYVASQSRSNYLLTPQSLASSLNMDYINHLRDTAMENTVDKSVLYQMIQDNKVWRFLKSQGYKYIHIGSWWSPTSKNVYADKNIVCYPLPEFSWVLFRTTMLFPIYSFATRIIGIRGFYHGDIALCQFEKLAEIPCIKEPTFTFVHILLIHPPYVFDRNGKFLTLQEINKNTERENYINQLIFVNNKMEEVIDKLLSNSEAPIIILQSDEGPYPPEYAWANGITPTNFEQITRAELKEKTGILNSYYLPDVDSNVLYPGITPVNSFRLLFNLYFNTNFELLPDETYAYAETKYQYKFFNITDKLSEN